ncbi:hypothetical protein GCM10025781_23780 [Kocuria gwangalliensis]|uniref:Uncharacterized protein n=1 Tax=Kocuria gwangalliensis TaxID=501592 RepID=A0ABP8XBB6_9MICC
MSWLSREYNGLRTTDASEARAARTRYRLVSDLEPGMATDPLTGRSPVKGAAQWGSVCDKPLCVFTVLTGP